MNGAIIGLGHGHRVISKAFKIEKIKLIGVFSKNLNNAYKYSKKNKLKILMHCFTGTKQFAEKLLELNAYFSASGIITFKKSNDLKETFKAIPLNKILIETDAPYLSPEPLRGKSNEPSNVVLTAKYLSKLKEIKFDDLCEVTTNNFFKLFGKLS